jgi:penicillin amidase
MTTNEPDIADVWEVEFGDPDHPLQYEYEGSTRTAHEWRETIHIRTGGQQRAERYTFRQTHHGPIVGRKNQQTQLAARISGLYDVVPMRQAMVMMKARSLGEFKTALALMQMPFMNIVYADQSGNIYYVYNARVPRRDPALDWSQPVNGADPQAEWLGIHGLDELPQVLNPPSGFIQNCNSSPFITTDGANPMPTDFPAYLAEDAEHRNRRALRSLELLRSMDQVTLAQFESAAFDTEIYWARHEMPKLVKSLASVRKEDPDLADRVEPLVDHLLEWDCRITPDSTAATLCTAWYERLYGSEYPGELMLDCFQNQPDEQLRALDEAAVSLERMFGDWQVPYGQVYRLQKQPYTADLMALRFNDRSYSLPTVGGHGPMGVIFTQYYTPSIHIPLLIQQRKRYTVVGPAYLAVYEFAPDGVRGKSVVPYGTSGRPSSRHFFDQAHLLSQCQMKPILFEREEVLTSAVRSYRPGE